MNVVNKVVGFLLNPLFIGMLFVAVGLALAWFRRRNGAIITLGLSLLWFWFWAMPIVGGWLALPLEKDYSVRLADAGTPTVLLVTSACHMRRSLYMFEKYAPEIECLPAATDYQALPWRDYPFRWRHILPDAGAFVRNNAFIHEYIGYYGYKWFR